MFIAEPSRAWLDLYWRLADEARENLERSRATIAEARAFLAAERRRRGREAPAETVEHPAMPQETHLSAAPPPTLAEDGRVPIRAWLALGDGSPEQDEAVREAVGEIVQLHYLLVEGLCRHMPAMAETIREVAQHLFEHAPNLTDPNCCAGARVGALRRPDELRN